MRIATAPAAEPEAAPASGSTNEPRTESGRENEPIGEAPPEDATQIFLRQTGVLLQPGEGQWDIGLTYVWNEAKLPVLLPSGLLALEHVRDRRLLVPISLRYGVTEHMEVFGQLPVGLSTVERADPDEDQTSHRGGIGDVTAGLKYLLHEEDKYHPDVIASISFSAPTGADPILNEAALGSGFWSLSGDLTFIRTFDPVIMFWGAGYTHHFDRRFQGIRVEPGDSFRYSLGLGFAVNDDVVLSADFQGEFQMHLYVDGERVPNSFQEPLVLRFAMTRVISRHLFVEPFVAFGLNSDAPDAQIGVSWTKGFGKRNEKHESSHSTK